MADARQSAQRSPSDSNIGGVQPCAQRRSCRVVGDGVGELPEGVLRTVLLAIHHIEHVLPRSAR